MKDQLAVVHQELVPDRPLTAEEVIARSQIVQGVVARVMKSDTHYGVIPGCKKPSLYQPGAQQLAVTFGLNAEPEVINTIDTEEEYSVTVKVGVYSSSGICRGAALGKCSSREEKYLWRKTICQQEYDEMQENRRRIKWKKGKGGNAYKESQIQVSCKDVANTVLKMAQKRAYISAVLNATAASDQFAVDIEDIPRELLSEEEHESDSAPKTTSPKVEKQSVSPPPVGNGKETGLRRRIVAKLNTLFKDDRQQIENFLIDLNTTIEGINSLDYGQLTLILECIDYRFEEQKATP